MSFSTSDMMRAMYQNSTSAVVSANLDRELTAMNPAAERLFGYSEQEVIGKKSQIIYADPRDYSRLGQSHFNSLNDEDGLAKPYRAKYRTKDGRVFDGETIGCPIFDDKGKRQGFLCIISDVTHRLALQAKLEASDIQLRAALASANEGAFSLNLVTGLGSTRGFINEFMGISTTDATISLERWRQVIEDSHRARFDASLDELRKRPGAQMDESFLAHRSDGAQRWLQIRGRVSEFARDGSALRVTGVISDVTDRQALEQKLADRERQLADALTAGACGAWELDLEKQQITPIGEIRGMLGVPASPVEIDAEYWLEKTHKDQRDLVRSQIEAFVSGQQSEVDVTYQLRDARTDTWRWLRAIGKTTDEKSGSRKAAGVLIDVTENMRLEQRAEESEMRLRGALEATGEGAWHLNLQTLEASITSVLSRMMGLGDGDADTRFDTWLERVHDDDQELCHETLAQLIKGDPGHFDFNLRYRSEEDGWIHLHNRGRVTEWDEDGRPTMAAGFMTDVTELANTTEALAQREQLLSDAIEASTLAIWRYDRPANMMWLRGDIVADLYGEGRERSIPGQEWHELHHPDDIGAAYKSLDGVWSEPGKSQTIDFRLKTHSGEWIWYRATGRRPLIDGTQPANMTTGVVINIDAAVRENEAVEAERKRFEQIYNATPAMLHTIEIDSGEIVQVSDFWLQSLGYRRSEIIGRKSTDFLDEESARRAREHSFPALEETGFNENIPYRFRRHDGSYMDVLLSSFLVDDGGVRRSYAVMTDVTPLRTAYEQLERSNKELDRFATVASHDLQEPLRKISAFAALVRRRYGDEIDAEGVRSLDFLVDAAQRMQGLIDDLLTYSKMASQPLRMQSVDLDDLIADVIDTLDTSINESGAQIQVERLPKLRGDPLLLRQSFQNLISNAVKYRSDGAPKVTVTAEMKDQELVLCVRDDGIGLDPKFAEKIFAPFQRLHSRDEYKGTGIGLAIVRQSIERHGGRVWVESEPGQGSAFYVALPVRIVLGPADAVL